MRGKKVILLFVPVVATYIVGMFPDIMEIDAAQYANMSREMLESGNYLQLFDRGSNYLDKPPLLFWLSSLSYRLFGISNFTYRLPSVLFSLLGIWSTYGLGKALYDKRTGFYAALILSSCYAWFLINTDVRTDTILAACTIFGIWQVYLYLQKRKLPHLLLAALGIAGAMLTKGPVGLMVPAMAIGTHLIMRREWKKIIWPDWLLLLALVLACLTPMLIGLYQQYDLQPGKLIEHVPINSGLKFYFWTQSFGRITGESVWKDDSTQLFFTHTFLWAFLPWSLFFLTGLWQSLRRIVASRFYLPHGKGEALLVGGFVIPFIVFSFSHYKLPHYIFCLFPLAAIISASYLRWLLQHNPSAKVISVWSYIQLFIAAALFFMGGWLIYVAFPGASGLVWAVAIIAVIAAVCAVLWGKNSFRRVVLPSFLAITTFCLIMNAQVYPGMFDYVTSNIAAREALASSEGIDHFASYKNASHSLDLYARKTVPDYNSIAELTSATQGKVMLIYTTHEGYNEILSSGLAITATMPMQHYHISRFSIAFLNPTTRSKQTSTTYLIKVDSRSNK